MTEFPLIGGQVALSNGATQSTDSFVNGIRMNTGGAALASTSAPSTISNGLPFTSAGVLSYVDASAGLPAGTAWTNGIPLSSAGSICVSPTAPTTWSNGIPFDVNGAVSALVSSLELNFLQGSLDARVTFARADATTCATYFDATGKLATAAANVPRFDYDPVTLLPRGLLIEESRQNLLLQSRDMTQAVWSLTGSTTAAQNAVGLDGVANSCSTVTASAATHARGQVISVTASTSYVFSFYAKRGTMTDMKYSVYNVTGAADIIPATSYYSQTNSSTFSRITVAFTTPVGCTSVNVYLLRDSGVTGTAIFDCAQLEVGAFATSIIPTTTTTLTRAADSASMTGTNFSSWFNASAGTFVVEATADTGAFSVTKHAFQLNNGGISSNQLGVSYIYQSAFVIADSPTSATKSAVAISANDYAICNGGGAVRTGTGAMVTWDRVYLGAAYNGNYANCHVRSLRYYPTRLANATLQALTA